MEINLLLIVVVTTFLSQLLVLSVINPVRFRSYRRELRRKFPPEHYPLLYPVPTARIMRLQTLSIIADWTIFCVGFLILVTSLVLSISATRIAMFMTLVGCAQVFSKFPQWRINYQVFRAYKSAAPPTVRSATLKIWTLWDFVSPTLVVCGITVTTLGVIVPSVIALSQPRFIPLVLVMVSMDLFLLARMIRVIFRPLLPRFDPYATNEDVFAARKRGLRALFVGASAFAIMTTIELLSVSHVLNLRVEFVMVGVSLLIQMASTLIVTTAVRQLRTRDFSAYRAPAAMTPSGELDQSNSVGNVCS